MLDVLVMSRYLSKTRHLRGSGESIVLRFLALSLISHLFLFSSIAVLASDGVSEIDEITNQAPVQNPAKQTKATPEPQESSLNIAIGATDKIVSGLSKRLSVVDNVPPETVADILRVALQIYDDAGVDGNTGASDLQRLISVDIRTSIAETELTLGNHRNATRLLLEDDDSAITKWSAVCTDNMRSECLARELRIRRIAGQTALAARPRTRETILSRYKALAQAGKKAYLEETQKFEWGSKHKRPEDARDYQLFFEYWRARATEAQLLIAIASLPDQDITRAQRSGLLKIAYHGADGAGGGINACVRQLKPEAGAAEGNLSLIFETNRSTPVAQTRRSATAQQQRADTVREIRAQCQLIAGEISAGSAELSTKQERNNLLAEASKLAGQAGEKLASLNADYPDNLPIRLLWIKAQTKRGFHNAMVAGTSDEDFKTSAGAFIKLVAEKKYRHWMIENAFLDFADSVRATMTQGNLSGAEKDVLGLPIELRQRLLKTAVETLDQRISIISEREKRAAEQGVQSENLPNEGSYAKQLLAAMALPLMKLYSKEGKQREIANLYNDIKDDLPGLETTAQAYRAGEPGTGDVFVDLLTLSYHAATAIRALDGDESAEATAIDILYQIELFVQPAIENLQKLSANTDAHRDLAKLRYLHAYATRKLSEIDVQKIPDGDARDTSLKNAFTVVEQAQASEPNNIEFKFALASVLYSQGEREIQRGKLEEATKKFERARTLGSDKAALKLVTWARTGTGPDGRIDNERAERLERDRRQNTPFQFIVKGVSEIFPEEREHKMFISRIDGNLERSINDELARLKKYYGVVEVDRADLARLRDIVLKAEEAVGVGTIITSLDLDKAQKDAKQELERANPFGDAKVAAQLAQSETLMKDGDFGRARDAIAQAERELSPEVTSAADVRDWGLVALQYMRLAKVQRDREHADADEASAKDYTSDKAIGDTELFEKIKDASKRALARATNFRILREKLTSEMRIELHATLEDLAERWSLKTSEPELSFETNKSFPVRFNEVQRELQALAIEQLTSGRSVRQLSHDVLLSLIHSNIKMAEYAEIGAAVMRQASEELQSARTRLFTGAMRRLAAAYSFVDELEARGERQPVFYAIERLRIQNAVARFHIRYDDDEASVGRRLASEAADDAQGFIDKFGNNLDLQQEKAASHELHAYSAYYGAIKIIRELNDIINDLGQQIEGRQAPEFANFSKPPTSLVELVPSLRERQDDVLAYVRKQWLAAGKLFRASHENFDQAIKLREGILSVKPDSFCACRVNDGVRFIAYIARYREIYKFPGGGDLPTVETFLAERIERWRKRARDDISPDSTRYARWYLARAYALRDDLLRRDSITANTHQQLAVHSDADCEQQLYACADQEFRKIKSPNNQMRADHALFLSDRAFFQLRDPNNYYHQDDNDKNSLNAVLEAEQTIKEAHDIWLSLPYSVWEDLQTTDLNIPANFAHVASLKYLLETGDTNFSSANAKELQLARRIYQKYRSAKLRYSDTTWNTLISKDICVLRHARYPDFYLHTLTEQRTDEFCKAKGYNSQ